MNQKVKEQLSLLTSKEIKAQLIKWEKEDLSEAAEQVYGWMVDELMERLSTEEFCAFCEKLEEIGGFE